MPMSAPAAKERRLLAQRSKRRMAPEIKAANPKAMVKGKRSWLELVRARVWMNGWAIGRWNMRSGEVRTARNGSTAPMLRISAKEAAIIKISSIANWALRRGDICVQRRDSKLEMDIERKVLSAERDCGVFGLELLFLVFFTHFVYLSHRVYWGEF